MGKDLPQWRRSSIRNSLRQYREAQEAFYLGRKPVVTRPDGTRAFSLLSPPLGSPAAVRRVRLIMRNTTHGRSRVDAQGGVRWGARTPHFVTLAITYACQCDCAHCSASDYRRAVAARGDGLTTPELKQVIRDAIALGTTCMVFTGGEPLLHPDLPELIAAVDRERCICALFTNGERLDALTVRRLAAAGLLGVFVSLDDSDPARHDAHRCRPGLYRAALEGLRRCADAGILTGLSTYVTSAKIASGELERMLELGRTLGVLEVFLFDVIATGRLDGRREAMLTPADIEAVREFRARYNEKPEYPRVIHQTQFTSVAYPCAAEGCPAGLAQVHIRANGDVSPCDFTPVSFGNLRDRPLRRIWETLSTHELFGTPSKCCRLADPAYWEKLDALRPVRSGA